MDDINSIKQEYFDFAYIGLDHGINSIADNGGPLIPFVLSQTGSEKKLQRFVTDKYEDGPLQAEDYLKNLTTKPDKALIAFDGFVTLGGEKSDAIIVRCYDKLESDGLILAQRYAPKKDSKGVEPVGNATLLGRDLNLLKSDNISSEVKIKKPWWKFQFRMPAANKMFMKQRLDCKCSTTYLYSISNQR